MDRQIIISVEPRETRVGILEDGKLQEILIERAQEKTLVGNIYKGVVRNVLPAIQAAFVDIGLDRNGFLHASDITSEVAACREIAGEEVEGIELSPRELKREPIDTLIQKGQEVLVQIIKEPIGTKGVRLSTNLSIAGRYLVMMPGARQIGISRRIEEQAERRRLRQILREIQPPHDVGFIVRTVGQGASREEFVKPIIFSLRRPAASSGRPRRRPVPPSCTRSSTSSSACSATPSPRTYRRSSWTPRTSTPPSRASSTP